MGFQTRQGDIFFEEVNAIPEQAIRSESPIVAYGEATGHSHCLVGEFTRFEDKSTGDSYIQTMKGVSSVHDEHAPNDLPDGKIFRAYRQREYDPMTAIPRTVID